MQFQSCRDGDSFVLWLLFLILLLLIFPLLTCVSYILYIFHGHPPPGLLICKQSICTVMGFSPTWSIHQSQRGLWHRLSAGHLVAVITRLWFYLAVMERPHAKEVISPLANKNSAREGVQDTSCWWRLCKSAKLLLHEYKEDHWVSH